MHDAGPTADESQSESVPSSVVAHDDRQPRRSAIGTLGLIAFGAVLALVAVGIVGLFRPAPKTTTATTTATPTSREAAFEQAIRGSAASGTTLSSSALKSLGHVACTQLVIAHGNVGAAAKVWVSQTPNLNPTLAGFVLGAAAGTLCPAKK